MSGEVRACPSCGGTGARLVVETGQRSTEGTAYRVVGCVACGLHYTDPLPSDEELQHLYSEAYYGSEAEVAAGWDRLRLLLRSVVMWNRRQSLGRRSPGRILDLGCGDGDFLAELGQRGWETYGCEFSAAAAARARKKGIKTHQGPLSEAGFEDEFFDAVTLWHVLEHLPDPRRELAEVKRILKPDGVLVVEVPDLDSPTFRLCGASWFCLDVPRHLQHSSATTVEALMTSAGLRPARRQRYHPFDFIIAAISFSQRLRLLGKRSGAPYFVTDFRRAGALTKLRFLLVGAPILALSLPYSVLATGLGGHGETMRFVAARAAS